MDRAAFEAKVARIKQGEFSDDTSLRGYVSDNLLSVRKLFDALWDCCCRQNQRIELIRKMNNEMEDSVRRLMTERRELKQEIAELHEQIAIMDALLMAKEQTEQKGEV